MDVEFEVKESNPVPLDISDTRKSAIDKWGLVSMNLTEELADFYLLYSLCLEGKAVTEFDVQLDKLERQFRAYTDMAVGGELRHARGFATKKHSALTLPSPLKAAFADGHLPQSRHGAWIGWYSFRLKYGTVALLWAERVFSYMHGGLGGKRWAKIAKVLRMYETGKITKITFVDACWGLQHNGGVYLNKIWAVHGINKLLTSVMNGNLGDLVLSASKEVGELWNGSEAVKS